MSIIKQKKICYIPIINFCIIMFCWIRMYLKNNVPKSRFIKNLAKIFLLVIIVTIPEIVVSKMLPVEWLIQCLWYINAYLIMLIPSIIAIKDQEKYILEISEK